MVEVTLRIEFGKSRDNILYNRDIYYRNTIAII